MRRIKYTLEIGYCGCQEEGEMEVDDGATSEEIDTMIHDMALEHAVSWEGDERLGWHDEMSEEEYEEATEHFYANVCGSWEFVDEKEPD